MQALLRDAGYPDGLPISLIAPEDLEVQATVVEEDVGAGRFHGDLKMLDSAAYYRQVLLSQLERPPEQQAWDIALAFLASR